MERTASSSSTRRILYVTGGSEGIISTALSFGNGSIPQINFRKCIKRNSYSNRQPCTVASVKTLDARSWVSGGKTTIRILTTESLHNSRAETLRPDSCEPGLFLCRRQEDHDARNRNRPPTAQPDRQPEPNRTPAAQPNNRAEPNRMNFLSGR
jgi:hypothetical protein